MDEPTKGNEDSNDNDKTLIGLILFVACGILVIVEMTILIKRQIMRFALNSKSEQHVSICHDVPKKMKNEAIRRLERTVEIGHEPNLLNSESKNHSSSSTNFDTVPHLYRMKALQYCKNLENELLETRRLRRTAAEEFDMFLENHIDYLQVQIPQARLVEFYNLYRHARHEPKPFGKENYNRMVKIVTEMSNMFKSDRIQTARSPAIRPIADITDISDEQLPTISRVPSAQFKFPIRQTVIGLAGRVFKKSKSKQEYQSVPSSDSIDDIDETSQL